MFYPASYKGGKAKSVWSQLLFLCFRFDLWVLVSLCTSGIRRVVAGEFVAVDPRGRAVMTAAVERQKFVYVLNRDSKTQLTISSPLEAHKARVVCLDCCGVDVGFDNPLFATIEMVYQDEKSGKAQQSQHACAWHNSRLSRQFRETVQRNR